MGKIPPATRKYKSQNGTSKQGLSKKVKRLNGRTLQSFFPPQHNLKHDENIFKCLDNDTKKVYKNTTNEKAPKINKPYKPPPLILTDKSFKIDQFLACNEVTKYNIKLLSIGTKIFFENDNDLLKISNALKQANVEHFTYASKDIKTYKVVLAGLPEIPTEVINEELKSLNVHPCQIVQMTLKNPNPHRALYLVHLNGKENTFQDIQRIQAICHTLVKWSKYKPRARNVTQCRNCTMYGHGTRNCFRKPTCSLCASVDHSQQNCPLNNLSKDSTPVYKCSYCVSKNLQSINHRANDASCPGRKAYIDAREKASQRQRNNNNNNQPTSGQRKNHLSFTPAPNPPPLIRSFKDVVINSTVEETEITNRTGDVNNDLFTTAELLKIFMKSAEELRNCKSKLDQIQVITNLLSHVV